MGSLEIQTVDPASYYRVRDELDAASFTSTDGGRRWTGPIAEPLRAFTDSEQMTIVFRDGWPFLHPELEVPGMKAIEHVNALGYVCLWAPGDQSQTWRTLDGWHSRIEEWCERQTDEFSPADATMDAHAYFGGGSVGALAVLDLAALEPQLKDGDCVKAFGRWRRSQGLLEITTDAEVGGNVRGLCFYRSTISAPPTDLERLGLLLTDRQRTRLERLVQAVARDRDKRRQFVVLAWGRGEGRNALVLLFDQQVGNQVRARTLEFAPSDFETLRLRAGEGAGALGERSVIVFGAGSVGSHTAVLLTESGLGSLTLVDGERLRPGNVVRHAAPGSFIGERKVIAVTAVIAEHVPWASVEQVLESPWEPKRLRELIADHDFVVDATGNAGFAEQLSILLANQKRTLVTATLYRQGHLARVQRQGPGDVPIVKRDDEARYPLIPPGPDEDLQLEPGCSAPVNRASPRAVVSCAALAADVVLDSVTGPTLPDEITDIYRPLDERPFDQIGRRTSA